MTTATDQTEKFRKVYADAVLSSEDQEAQNAARIFRELTWKGERMPLAEAAKLYAMLEGGYNEFEPDMIQNVADEFPEAGIEVTPAREMSPAIYFHVESPAIRRRLRIFVEDNLSADTVEYVEGDTLRVWWD